jgi:hypothetical protein
MSQALDEKGRYTFFDTKGWINFEYHYPHTIGTVRLFDLELTWVEAVEILISLREFNSALRQLCDYSNAGG